jgi:hypothetical protein
MITVSAKVAGGPLISARLTTRGVGGSAKLCLLVLFGVVRAVVRVLTIESKVATTADIATRLAAASIQGGTN